MWKKIGKALLVAGITPFLEAFASEAGNKIAERFFGKKDEGEKEEDEDVEETCGRGEDSWCSNCKDIAAKGYSDESYTFNEETLMVRIPVKVSNGGYVGHNLSDLLEAEKKVGTWILDRKFSSGKAFKLFRKSLYQLSADKAAYILDLDVGELMRLEEGNDIPSHFYDTIYLSQSGKSSSD